jgi:uncharacterized membrane protein
MNHVKSYISLSKLILTLFLFFQTNVQSQTYYNIIEIGNGFVPSGMNNNLEVVGTQGTTPVLWKNGNLTILQTPNANGGSARGISNSGEIVGHLSINDTSGMMAKWDLAGNVIFVDNEHTLSIGYNINDFSNVSGMSRIGYSSRPTVWINNLPVYLLPPNSQYSNIARDINNNNWVVGGAFDNSSSHYAAFVWKGTGNIIFLPDLNGIENSARAINNQNLIVGYVLDPNTNNWQAVYWENDILNIIEMPAGVTASYAYDINSSNEIVGVYSSSGIYTGFIFKDGERMDLEDLLPPNSGWTIQGAYVINDNGAVLALGKKNGVSKNCILIPNAIIKPEPYTKWIAGESDTIKWIENGWTSFNIKCKINFETADSSEVVVATGVPLTEPEFIWDIPDTIFSYRSKIILENANNPDEKIESSIFRIKPYCITRVQSDSTYYAYNINNDRWGFGNNPVDVWPPAWYNQFNYQGIDPFTNNLQYSQTQGDSTFGKSKSHDHPDWVSWVNTFGVDACYFSAFNGFYKPTALLKWSANSENWGGSCFGFAIANALAFEKKTEFLNKYSEFPNFLYPINVGSNNNTIPVINELFTHQFGNPHFTYRQTIGLLKTPKETIADLREMLKEDNSQVRTISFNRNTPPGDPGGHAILAYGLQKDEVDPDVLDILVYDNSYADDLTAEIEVDTSLNAWTYSNFPNWGGQKWLYLRNPVSDYLNTPIMAKSGSSLSPFILDDEELQIFNTLGNSVKIQDSYGNVTGYFGGTLQINIQGSVPFIVDNGSITPPYGYSLPTNNYSVVLNEFEEDTIETFFFIGNKSFSYERSGAIQTQTDRLFFDGGVSSVNPDAQTKTVKLLNLINETTQEKLTVVRSIELAQNDSVKIENPDSNKVKLISYGSDKDYDIELNYVTETGLERFGDFNIQLSANTSHTFVPDWTNISNSQLFVLVDVSNNGTIDDTLYLNNTVDVEDQRSLLSPNNFNLAQNYPNPFNPVTTIQYSISKGSSVTLKVYDVLGNEIAVLVNEEKDRGVYSVNFDASGFASGIYFYRLTAGTFVETKKMILLK